MAAGATIHTFDVTLADVDRGVYESFPLRMARHPSETEAFMITRLLAYCLEYEEGIDFTEGIAAKDEPAVLVRDLTGAIVAWVEVGAPDASRLHLGSKQSGRVAVYTHRNPGPVAAAWAGKKIHRASEIPLYSFEPGFIDTLASALDRRNVATVSITERRLYVELGGVTAESDVTSQPAA